MQILNYTGEEVGFVNEGGIVTAVLHSNGNARCKIDVREVPMKDKSPFVPKVYRRQLGQVIGLPTPDANLEKYYIVTKDVAEAVGNSRMDLLLADEPVNLKGKTYYKKLIMI